MTKVINQCLKAINRYCYSIRYSKCALSTTYEDRSSEVYELMRKHAVTVEDGWTCLRCNVCSSSGGKKFFVSRKQGNFICLQCNKRGTLDDLNNLLSCTEKRKQCHKVPLEADYDLEKWSQAIPVDDNNIEYVQSVLSKHGLENLPSLRTLQRCRARLLDSEIVVPCVGIDKNTVESVLNLDYKLPVHLFGLQTIANSRQSDLIITTSTLDAICAFEGNGGKPVLAVSDASQMNFSHLACLEQFRKIYLWSGTIPSDSGSPNKKISPMRPILFQLAKLLKERRCFIVSSPLSPSEALKNHQSFKEILQSAYTVLNEEVLHFSSFREAVRAEIEQSEKFVGVRWRRFPLLNQILKGHRLGELTVLTGATGCGKTTFLSEYSLDLCMQGVHTLWGSFEIRNHKLAKTMLTQFAGCSLQDKAVFEVHADAFSELPLHFMNFHGAETIERVVATMAGAVVVHDIAHVIIDNLQFMMGMDFTNADRFYRQDLVVHSLRRFATLYNCHVTLVIHPRKDTDECLGISSIFGSAKASQEADNVLIIQQKRVPGRTSGFFRYVDVVKNRFDGELGRMPLRFNKETLSFSLNPLLTSLRQNHVEKSL